MRMGPVSRGNFTRVGAKDKRPLGRQRAFVELNTTSPRLQPGGGLGQLSENVFPGESSLRLGRRIMMSRGWWSPPPDVGHLVGGDGDKGDVHIERESGEMEQGVSDVLGVETRFGGGGAVCLEHTIIHVGGHVGGGVANINLTASDMRGAVIERDGFGETGDGVFSRVVGRGVGAWGVSGNGTVVDDAAPGGRLGFHEPHGSLGAKE